MDANYISDCLNFFQTLLPLLWLALYFLTLAAVLERIEYGGKRAEHRERRVYRRISRTHSSTFFDEMNVHAQCASCNMFRNGQPHIYAERIIKKYGLEAFYALLEKGKETKKFTKVELLQIHDDYKAKLGG